MIYLVLLIILLFLALSKHKKVIDNHIVYCGLMLFMAFIAGGRGIEVGVDTKTYEDVYLSISKNGYLSYLEPGWNILNLFANWLDLSYNGLLLVAALIMLVPVFLLSKKISENPYIPLFIYFAIHVYDASFNAMRQYTALSYVLLAYYYYLCQKSWFKVALCIIVAISLHKSCFLVVPVLIGIRWLSVRRIDNMIFLFIFALACGIFANESFFSLFSMDYKNYINSDLYRDSSVLACIFSVITSAFSLLLFALIPRDKRNTAECKLYIVSIVVLLLTFRLHYGARIYVMFSISQLFFIPYLLKVQQQMKRHVLNLIIYSFYTVVYMRMWLLNANSIMPYSNVWL